MNGPKRSMAAALIAWLLGGCSSPPPMPPVAQVDLPRFMGDWYVIAHIPSFPERNAYNAIETYKLDEDGRIRTTFRYRDGSYDAKVDTMHPTGTVQAGTNNAIWGMQFIWPIKAEYVIAYLDPDYQRTIVARSKRDYVWIMARTPTLPDADYTRLVDTVKTLGYDVEKLRKVPQRWPEDAPR